MLYKFPHTKGCFSTIDTFDLHIAGIGRIGGTIIRIVETYSVIIGSFVIFICKVPDPSALFKHGCLIFHGTGISTSSKTHLIAANESIAFITTCLKFSNKTSFSSDLYSSVVIVVRPVLCGDVFLLSQLF